MKLNVLLLFFLIQIFIDVSLEHDIKLFSSKILISVISPECAFSII
jgi:hypothetical protein